MLLLHNRELAINREFTVVVVVVDVVVGAPSFGNVIPSLSVCVCLSLSLSLSISLSRHVVFFLTYNLLLSRIGTFRHLYLPDLLVPLVVDGPRQVLKKPSRTGDGHNFQPADPD